MPINIFLKGLYIILIINSVECLKVRTWIEQEGYHNDKQITKIIGNVTKNGFFTQKICNNTNLYKYLEYGNQSSTYHAFITCNIHARQLIATQICLKWLLENQNGSDLLNKYFIRIFYNANVMRQKVVKGDDCIRKNQNNVDANRNFPQDFNHFNASQDNDTYGGKKPLDQPLSQCLNALFIQKTPDLYLDIHSGQNNSLLYQPTTTQGNKKQLILLNEIKTNILGDQYSAVQTVYDDGDQIDGQIFADIKIRMNVTYSFLFEVYQANVSLQNGCFLYFNPIEDTKKAVIKTYVQIINYMLKRVIQLQTQQS